LVGYQAETQGDEWWARSAGPRAEPAADPRMSRRRDRLAGAGPLEPAV